MAPDFASESADTEHAEDPALAAKNLDFAEAVNIPAEEPAVDIFETGETPADDAMETTEVPPEEKAFETPLPEDEMPEKDIALAGAMGIQLDPGKALPMEPAEDGADTEPAAQDEAAADLKPPLEIPKEDIEAATERVIETKLGDKIDSLLNSAIEKAVSDEISRLKRMLTETLSKD
jgi:hypothetical protein